MSRLGTDRLARWGGLLGLGQPTGFEVGGEISGVMPDEAWHDKHLAGGYQRGMSVNISIGQGDVNVTPMQQVVMFAALGTGILWKPQVVKRVESPDGGVVMEMPPIERSRVPLSADTRAQVLKGLKAAVNEPFGTAYGSRLKDVMGPRPAGGDGRQDRHRPGGEARREAAQGLADGLLGAGPRLVRRLRAGRRPAESWWWC